VDFLLAVIELFLLGVTAKALRAIIGLKSAILLQCGPVDPEFQVEGAAPTNHSSSQKTRLNDLSYDIKMWTYLSSILSGITRVTDRQTDRRTDRILIARSHLHFMQRAKNLGFNKCVKVLPHCMECQRVLATRKVSVCLSVCQRRALWQNGRKICPDFYTIRKVT